VETAHKNGLQHRLCHLVPKAGRACDLPATRLPQHTSGCFQVSKVVVIVPYGLLTVICCRVFNLERAHQVQAEADLPRIVGKLALT